MIQVLTPLESDALDLSICPDCGTKEIFKASDRHGALNVICTECSSRFLPLLKIAYRVSDPEIANDLDWLQAFICQWAARQFPGQPITGITKHLVKEAEELAKSPDDLGEMADCMVLLLQIAERANISASELLRATYVKFYINQARQWGKMDRDGVVEHVKS